MCRREGELKYVLSSFMLGRLSVSRMAGNTVLSIGF